MALGGVMAALAVVIMSLGGLIPLATYCCPVLCILLLQFVLRLCGKQTAFAWYLAVSILGLLLGNDKEAAAVFLFIGYYPLVKPKLERLKFPWLWKALLFNVSILVMYWLLINLFGMAQVASEFAELGIVMLIVTLLMGNFCFFLVDVILGRKLRFRR